MESRPDELVSTLLELANRQRWEELDQNDSKLTELAARAAASDHPIARGAGLTLKARQLLVQLRPAEAVEYFSQAAELMDRSPGNAGGLVGGEANGDVQHLRWWFNHLYADALDDVGRHEDAFERWGQAMSIAEAFRLDNDWLRTCLNMVYYHRTWGVPQQALVHMKSAIDRTSEQDASTRLLDVLADVHLDAGLPSAALDYARRSATLSGAAHSRQLRLQADAFIQLRRFSDAESVQAEAQEVAVTTSEQYLNLFSIWRLQQARGDAAAAVETAGRAVGMYVTSRVFTQRNPYLLLAESLLDHERYGEAADVLTAVTGARLSNFDKLTLPALQARLAERDGDRQRVVELLAERLDLAERLRIGPTAVAGLHRSLVDMGYVAGMSSASGSEEMPERGSLILAAATSLRAPLASLRTAAEMLTDSTGPIDERLGRLVGRAMAELELSTNQLSAIQILDDYDKGQGVDVDSCSLDEALSRPLELARSVAATKNVLIAYRDWPTENSPNLRVRGPIEVVEHCLESILWLATHRAESESTIEVVIRPAGETLEFTVEVVVADEADPSASSSGNGSTPAATVRLRAIRRAAGVLGAAIRFAHEPGPGPLPVMKIVLPLDRGSINREPISAGSAPMNRSPFEPTAP